MPLSEDEKIKREEQVSRMISEGKTVNQMARELGLTGQSVWKFLKVRGWMTKAMEEKAGTNGPKDKSAEDIAKAKARIEARKKMPSSYVDRG